MTTRSNSETASIRPVALSLNGGKVSAEYRAALFEAASREGVSVNQLVLEATAYALRKTGYHFKSVFPDNGPHSSQYANLAA